MPSTADYLDSLVARGIIGGDALERLLPGGPQRQSRGEIFGQQVDELKDYLTPSYLRDTPSSSQADRALTDPNAKPGKIGPPSGPPTTAQMIGGFAGDVAANALPYGKLLAGKLAGPLLEAVIPFWVKAPAKAARADELIAGGHSAQYVADDIGVGKASVQRYLAQSGQKTAAAENPTRGVLGDPANDEVIKAGLARGDSYAKIAQRIGTSPGNVFARAGRLRDAGELSGIELRPSSQSQSLLADPVKRADLIRLAKEGTSQGNIASYFYGGPGGKHPRRGDISAFIRQLQQEGTPEEREALKNYAPQGGTGLTPAGRTPTLPQPKIMSQPVDEAAGQDWVKALKAAGLLKD